MELVSEYKSARDKEASGFEAQVWHCEEVTVIDMTISASERGDDTLTEAYAAVYACQKYYRSVPQSRLTRK